MKQTLITQKISSLKQLYKKKIITICLLILCFASSKSQNTIFDFIENNDINQVKQYIENKNDVNIVNPATNLTPLIYAVKKNNLKLVKLLIKSGAKIDTFYTDHDSSEWYGYDRYMYDFNNALVTSLKQDNKQITNYLIKKYDFETDLEFKEISYNTAPDYSYFAITYDSPLEIAIENLDFNLIRSLLKKGANPNLIKNNDYRDVGFYYYDYFIKKYSESKIKKTKKVKKEFLKTEKCFVENNAVSGYFFESLMQAIIDFKIEKYLYINDMYQDFYIKEKYITDTLAYIYQNLDNIINKGFKITDYQKYYGNPYEFSFEMRDGKLTKYLVENGANINRCRDFDNEIPISIFISKKDSLMIKYFIEKGAHFQNSNFFNQGLYGILPYSYIDSLIYNECVNPSKDIEDEFLKYMLKTNKNDFLIKVLNQNPKYVISTSSKSEEITANILEFFYFASECQNKVIIKYMLDEKILELNKNNIQRLKKSIKEENTKTYFDSILVNNYFSVDSVLFKPTIFGSTNITADRKILLSHQKFDFIFLNSDKYKVLTTDSFPEKLIDSIKNCEANKNFVYPLTVTFNNNKTLDFKINIKIIDTLKSENLAHLCGKISGEIDKNILINQNKIDFIFADSLSKFVSFDVWINNKKIGTYKTNNFTTDLKKQFENLITGDSLKIQDINILNSKNEKIKLNEIKLKINFNPAYFCYATVGGFSNCYIPKYELLAYAKLQIENNLYNLKVKEFLISALGCDFCGQLSNLDIINGKQKALITQTKSSGKIYFENIVLIDTNNVEYNLPYIWFIIR